MFASLGAPSPSHASVSLGTGYTSVAGGRGALALHAGLELGKDWSLSGFSWGVQTSAYSHSAWQADVLRTFDGGKFLWGPLDWGIGWGLHVAARSYDESAGDEPVSRYDLATGPTFRVEWGFAGPVFFAMEAMFGIRDLNALYLSFQDTSYAMVGVRL